MQCIITEKHYNKIKSSFLTMWSSRTACLIPIAQSLNAFQKEQFPFHATVPVISAPENECRPGRN